MLKHFIFANDLLSAYIKKEHLKDEKEELGRFNKL